MVYLLYDLQKHALLLLKDLITKLWFVEYLFLKEKNIAYNLKYYMTVWLTHIIIVNFFSVSYPEVSPKCYS